MEVRLIDGNALLDKCENLYMRGHVLFHGVTACTIENAPTIDQNALPIVQAAKAMCKEMVKENRKLSKELDVSRQRSGDLSRELERTKTELDAMRTAASSLKMHLEKVTQERDAAIKELDGVSSLVDELADFVDSEIHPIVDYNLYLSLRENVDSVSMFQYEDEWRGTQKED